MASSDVSGFRPARATPPRWRSGCAPWPAATAKARADFRVAGVRRRRPSSAFSRCGVRLPFGLECLARAHQQRLGGAFRQLQRTRDLGHREVVAEAQLENACVVWRQAVDRAPDGGALRIRGALIERLTKVGELDDLGQRPLLGELLEALGLRLARGLAARIDEQVAADLAQPGEQRRTTA